VRTPSRLRFPESVIGFLAIPSHLPAFTQLYILPVSHKDEFKLTEGCFFTCEEIKQNPEKFSNELRIECERLQMVAQVWKEFK
jgi:hypothetical protein